MKAKTIGLFALSIFALVFLMSAVSAETSTVFTITDLDAPTSVSEDAGSFTFTFNLTYTGTSENMAISFGDSTLNIGSISIPTATGMNGTRDESRIITGTIDDFAGHGDETINVIINATSTATRDDETTFSVYLTTFCSYDDGVSENPGELSVKIKDVTVTEGFGDDEEWLLLDEIEVEIEIENKGDYDVDDISVEWGIANEDMTEWVIDMDEEDEFNLKDGDEEKLTITFRVDDDDLDMDLDELDESYKLFVRATGEVDNDTNPKTCASDSEDIEIIIESDFVALYDIEYPETVMCGETVQITADVWNIGDDDQDEVSVDLVAKGLGLDKTTLIGDIDAFDNDKFSFTFTVPNDAEEKTHTLKFQVWDEDNDVYENDFDEDESEFFLPLKVEGGCGVAAEDIIISATLESEAKEGKEMVIKATIMNNGDELETFTISAVEFTEWADLLSQDQNTLVLNAGESKDVLFTFDVKKDASGSQTFFIELVSGSEVTTQLVSVNVESSRPFLGITGFVTSDNAYLWGIGLLNIILIVIIILIAVRIARRK